MSSETIFHSAELTIPTRGYTLHNITTEVIKLVDAGKAATGLCTVFLGHTSASLIIQENADPDVLEDLKRYMAALVPEKGNYAHDSEGPDDMPAHIRTALTQSSIGIPIIGGKLALGVWQAIYLWEHRASPHQRHLIVSIMGNRP
jgi:secondary thiamine-phosphate synthase enzyme